MAKVKNEASVVTEVARIERFVIQFQGKRDPQVQATLRTRGSADGLTVKQWIHWSFAPSHHANVSVLFGDGGPVTSPQTKLGSVRRTYGAVGELGRHLVKAALAKQSVKTA